MCYINKNVPCLSGTLQRSKVVAGNPWGTSTCNNWRCYWRKWLSSELISMGQKKMFLQYSREIPKPLKVSFCHTSYCVSHGQRKTKDVLCHYHHFVTSQSVTARFMSLLFSLSEIACHKLEGTFSLVSWTVLYSAYFCTQRVIEWVIWTKHFSIMYKWIPLTKNHNKSLYTRDEGK